MIGEHAQAPPFVASVRAWLAEDLGVGDVTSLAVVPANARASGSVLLKEPGVICGLDVLRVVFAELDPEVGWMPEHRDGDRVEPGRLAVVGARARAILGGERVALNLLGRLSGIATLTRGFVDAVEGTGVTILDTRKTTPGLRALEKAAVRCGGGTNHRFGLYDGVLVKDNHIRFAGGIREAVERARAAGMPVQIECETIAQVREAVRVGADRLLLDNMSLEGLREAVAIVSGAVELEASGGVRLDNVRAIAETGVDYISIGALTHSVRSLDVSLEFLA